MSTASSRFARSSFFVTPLVTTLAALALAGCGGGAPKANGPAPAAVVKPAGRTPSAALAGHWVLSAKPAVAAYADLAGLRKTELMQGLLPAVAALASSKLPGERGACLELALGAADEVLVGADNEQALVLVRFDRAKLPAKGPTPEACLAASGESTPPPAGAKAAVKHLSGGAEELHVLTDSLYVMGDVELVKKALAAKGPATLPKGLELATDQYVALEIHAPALGLDGEAKVVSAPEKFSVVAGADVGAPGVAEKMEAEYRRLKEAPFADEDAPKEVADVVKRLKDGFTLKRAGDHLDVAFELRGTATEQAHDLGAAAALAVTSVGRYIERSKLAEPSFMHRQIAQRYVMAWEKQDPKKRAKKLWALPAVPAKVAGAADPAVELKEAAWASWKPIDFVYEGPAKFQYEVVVDKAGTTGTIVARGALAEGAPLKVVTTPVTLDPKTGTVQFGATSVADAPR